MWSKKKTCKFLKMSKTKKCGTPTQPFASSNLV